MLELNVDNSYCRLTGLTAAQHKAVKELLSYDIDSQEAYFSGAYRTKRSLFSKRGEFPTGLLYLVYAWLEKSQSNHAIHDHRKQPEDRHGLFNATLGHEPYPEQLEAAKVCLERHRGIVAAPTGCGKSVIAAAIIQLLQVPTLVVVPSLELKRQLTVTLGQIFGTYKVGDQTEKCPITVENVDALDPNKEASYAAVIIDEFHHSASKSYRALNKKAWKSVYYRFGLTATPFRSDDNERLLLESVLSQVIYRVEYRTAVDKGYIVPLEAYYVDCPRIDTEGYSWQEVYSDLVVNNEARNKIIKDLIHSLEGQSVLTLVKEIKHGEWLKTISGSPFANGQDESSRSLITQFASGRLKSLVATTGVMGEGVDSKPAEWIILAGLGKAKGAFMQQCGRAFRRWPGKESAKIILFRDLSHKWTKAHWLAQCKILREEYGIKPVRLEIP